MKVGINLYIPVGLPGSGKTYYCNKFSKNHSCRIINYDEQLKNGEKLMLVFGKMIGSSNLEKNVMLDGPWFSKDIVIKLIGYVVESINNHTPRYCDNTYYVNEIIIVHFNEDRETCLLNDKGRRSESSEITIRNTPYWVEITADDLNDIIKTFPEDNKNIKIMVEEKTVVTASSWDKAIAEIESQNDYFNGIYDDILRTDEWSGGGTWGNCWGDSGTISSDEPIEFDSFDKLLEMVSPNITFLQYKTIRKETCKMVENRQWDYYGGSETRYHWECDLTKLKEMLEERNLI